MIHRFLTSTVGGRFLAWLKRRGYEVVEAEHLAGLRHSARLCNELLPETKRLREWHGFSSGQLRLRCGELTANEIRTVRAVLSAITGPLVTEPGSRRVKGPSTVDGIAERIGSMAASYQAGDMNCADFISAADAALEPLRAMERDYAKLKGKLDSDGKAKSVNQVPRSTVK